MINIFISALIIVYSFIGSFNKYKEYKNNMSLVNKLVVEKQALSSELKYIENQVLKLKDELDIDLIEEKSMWMLGYIKSGSKVLFH